MIEVRVLGPVEVLVGGTPVPLGGRRQQAVLALLVAARGRVISVDRLVDQLWDGAPPSRPLASLQAYVSRLRRTLEPRRAPRAAPQVLVSESAGYALRLPVEAVDAWLFERRLHEAGPSLETLRETLELWRGGPFEQFADEAWARPSIERLTETRRAAQERVVAALLALRRNGEAVQAARQLTDEEPLRGPAWRLLALALWAGHRSAEALDALRQHRRRLAEELGLEPEPALAALEQAILDQRGDVLERESRGATAGGTVRPAQLPRSPAGFAARDAELDALTRHTGGLTVITGAGGVGKTTLAVRWAHQVAPRFPDGQLYADLRGYGPQDAPTAPGDVLLGFLAALGVPAHRVPPGESGRAVLFRSLVAGRRMLIVLDNARDDEQVRPLLPGTPGSAVVVTSRDRLGALTAAGARPVTLSGFDDEQSRAYLRDRLGPGADADPRARDVIVARCGGLPLALAMVCARAAGFPLAAVAAELTEEDGLDAFAGPGYDLRAVLSWSYRRLPEPAAALFRGLAAHPGPDLPENAVTSVAGPSARALLRVLCDAHLLTEREPARFSYHDLVRSYALELPDRDASVLDRLVAHFLHSATAAANRYVSYPRPDRVGPVPADVTPEVFATPEDALAWKHAEYRNIMALTGVCDPLLLGPWAYVLANYQQDIRYHLDDSFDLVGRALEVAEREGQGWWSGFLSYLLGRGHIRLGQRDQARHYLELTIAAGRATGDPLRLAHGLLGWALATIGATGTPDRADAEAAFPYAREALENYRRLPGGENDVARALVPIAWYHFFQPGGRAEADRLLHESLALHEGLDNADGVADTLIHLGRFRHASGDPAGAAAAFRRCLDLHDDLPELEIDALIGLYRVYADTGDTAAAGSVRAEALALVETARYQDVERLRTALGITAG
ncbi:AfsR/SARP family transcriptional regulator [Actinoplanes rectilineatus]|uniref:AfsR/SARP family transcriptional regulator n=1 Tax=Actinoplanes rectilineatus TaxID=113571 RepID=UPI0009F9161F|nr:BTAD domain-containing putative transcriptional regulator [Actinoplanes rectilineatus]